MALLKDLGGSPRLTTLIEGESLLNDGTAIVMFSVFFDMSTGEDLGGDEIVERFFRLAFGGVYPSVATTYAFMPYF